MAYYALCNSARRFILVLSPKCGTRTCKQWFLESLVPSERPDPDETLPVRIGRVSVPLGDLTAEKYADFHVAMVVRDPHRRLVAAYADQFTLRSEQWGHTDVRGDVRLPDPTFRDLVASITALHRRSLELQHHLQPQVRGVAVDRVDEFLVLERLELDLADLACRVQHRDHRAIRMGRTDAAGEPDALAADRRPEWFRQHGFPDPAAFYDDELAEAVAEVYHDDVGLYRSVEGAQPMRP